MRFSRFVGFRVFLLLWIFSLGAHAQQQMASLRPGHGLTWQRTSPTAQQPDGPVLYQLLLNASGTAGTIPVFDTNPRHLINSPIAISGGNVVIGGGSALAINGSSGLITFAPGQTFPASGLPNLAGEVTGAPSATVVSNAGSSNIPNAIVRRDGSGNFSASGIVLGNLALSDTSSSSTGVITFGGVPFVHDFGSVNTFVGHNAGNFTTTGIANTGMGKFALENNTTGNNNAAFGASALASNTSGAGNVAFGEASLVLNTTGSGNAAFGTTALFANTTGSDSSAFGFSALSHNTASNNSAFGFNALIANTSGGGNGAFGSSALAANTTGSSNAAFGFQALAAATTASENSAFGSSALSADTTGGSNSAFGSGTLFVNTNGAENAAFGAHALLLNSSGSDNSAFGFNALSSFTSGFFNTALGENALSSLGLSSGLGNSNIAVGTFAGMTLQNGNNNIYIGNPGHLTSESNNIYIGQQGVHAAAFIGGIFGATSASGAAVFVNSSGQLGTATSSRRYKQEIVNVGDESDVLMKLRPVAFYYKPELDDTHTRQYGLVAEEVAQIAPGLVIFDGDGQPQTVRYHFVNAMLLNEVQKQRRLIDTQQEQLTVQQTQIEALQQQIHQMSVRLETVETASPARAKPDQIAAAQ